jgi:uncharacterized protein YozE (UPF0346 family)
MLTDLSFIATGKPWPPEDLDEKARLAEHAFNRAIYNNQHEVFSKYAAYLQDKADDDKKMPIILGWGEKATTNYVNLCIGEDPDVELDGEDLRDERPDEEVLIDASRYGLGLYESTQDGIFCQNPEKCYIVNAPGNIRRVTEYVFFYQFNIETQTFIKFTIHGKGYIQHLIYEVDEGKLGESRDLKAYPAYTGLIVDPLTGIQKTGVDDILIVRVDNALSSERRYGRSDYTPSVCSLIEALELAFARREEVLAKFARPVFQAPESAFNHFNHAKQTWEIHLDEPILLEPGSLQASYLTWQAELGAVEKAIEDKMNHLLYMLDLVKVEEANKAESGTALALKLQPTLSRVKRFAKGLKKAIPKVEILYNQLLGNHIDPAKLTVDIRNGLPKDQASTILFVSTAYAGGFMSLETAVATAQDFEMDEDPESPLQKELARIRTARQQATPAEPAKIALPALGEANGPIV